MSLLQDLENWLGVDLVADDDDRRAAEFQGRMAAAQAAAGGESNSQGQPLFVYLALPDGDPVVGVPEGRTTLAFDDGEIGHTAYEDSIGTGKSLDDHGNADRLRSLALSVDVPAEVRLDNGPWFDVPVRETVTVQATAFEQVQVRTDQPAQIASIASTRSTTLSSSLAQRFERVGDKQVGTYDDYVEIPHTTPELVDRHSDYSTHADPVVSIDGRPASVVVANTSAAANDLVAEVRGRVDPDEDWRQLAESGAVPQGDNHIFAMPEGRVDEMQVRIQNSSLGGDVGAHTQVIGGH